MGKYNELFFDKTKRQKFQVNTIEIDPSILSRASNRFHLKYISHSPKNHGKIVDLKHEIRKYLNIK